MIYWRILTDDGRTGWQVMTAALEGAYVVDDDNQPFPDNIVYSVTDTSPTPPEWASA